MPQLISTDSLFAFCALATGPACCKAEIIMTKNAGYLPIEPAAKLLFLTDVPTCARIRSDRSRALPQCGQGTGGAQAYMSVQSSELRPLRFGESHAFESRCDMWLY